MDIVEFWTVASSNGIIIDDKQRENFERFYNEIIYWNERVNLISRKDMEHVYDRHILHSLSILKYFDIPEKAKCIDIGTGGGFPGIPLKIARPDIYMLLADSINKKMKITSMFADHTALKNIEARTCRVEDLEKEKKYQKHFDIVFARAVARIGKLIGWTKGIIKKNGCYVFLKGGDLKEEMEEAKKLFPNINYEIKEIEMIGSSWFKEEEKKIIICRLD